jgi:hypothetical protein
MSIPCVGFPRFAAVATVRGKVGKVSGQLEAQVLGRRAGNSCRG